MCPQAFDYLLKTTLLLINSLREPFKHSVNSYPITRYSDERKEAVLKKMLPPTHRAIASLAQEEGISEATLYKWRKAARSQGRLLPEGDQSPDGWRSADKFAAVLETVALSEAELSEYCRHRGLFPEQIQQWRQACEHANDWDRSQNQH